MKFIENILILFLLLIQTTSSLYVRNFRSKYSLSNKLYSTKESQNIPLKVKLADGIIQTAFSIKPLFKLASGKARSSMVERGRKIGVDWKENVEKLEQKADELQSLYGSIKKPSLSYPDYYLKAFHAYEEGNLSWQAAMEVESAALTVHAPIFTENNQELRLDGDYELRDRFHQEMKKMFLSAPNGIFVPKKILDIGCSTGLSTLKFHESFPEAEVIGVDLSPYMLAVAKHQLATDPKHERARKHITYLHEMGESVSLSGFKEGDVDLISLCLVMHELPEQITKKIMEEAYQILPSGGAIALMDMNPNSEGFQRLASNPFGFAAFKSTEPWIQEYVNMDLFRVLEKVGFQSIGIKTNSPRHRTIVAYKN